MSSKDDKAPPSNDPESSLLDELESIRGLLDDNIEQDFDDLDLDELSIDIPILEDVVDKPASSGPSLLDLEHIFDDEITDLGTVAADTSNHLAETADSNGTPIKNETIDLSSPLMDELDIDELSLESMDLESADLNDLDIDIDIPDFTADTQTPVSKVAVDDEQWLADDPLLDGQPDETDSYHPAAGEIQETLFPDPSSKPDNPHQESLSTAEPGTEPVNLDFMIQEIVDELIPQIEDELRKRLSNCSATVIQQLAKQYLDS